jgi:hypothetical protein
MSHTKVRHWITAQIYQPVCKMKIAIACTMRYLSVLFGHQVQKAISTGMIYGLSCIKAGRRFNPLLIAIVADRVDKKEKI